MSSAPGRILATAVAAVVAAVGLPATADASTGSTDFVTMVSESGDYVGGGANRIWEGDTASVSVSGSVSDEVSVRVSGGASGDSFALTFAAPPGQSLTAGTYEDAQRAPFRSSGHPGIDIDGDGRGCNTTSGRFTVLDVAPDLSRLWLVYEQHCEGGSAAAFGEVRYGEPGGDAGLLVAPDRVAWPDEYPGVAGRPVPVTLVNTGGSPVTVSSATITDGDADFSVVGNSCTTLAVGESCNVYVGFVPATAGNLHGVLTIADSTAAGVHTVQLGGTGISGRTAWQMHSETGDFVGAGSDWSYTPLNATITARGTESAVHFGATSGGGRWSADFASDSGHLLLPGTTFTDVTRYGFQATSSAGMDVSGMSRGCNELTGTFTVQDAAYVGGQLQRMVLTFEQHCEGSAAALVGSIAWRADDTAAPRLAAVTGLHAYPMLGSAVLTWTDPAADDWAESIVRRTTGRVPPASADAGTEVYAGRAGGSIVDGLLPGNDYSFSVFPRNTLGTDGPVASVTLHGSTLSIARRRATVTAGDGTQVGGRLLDAHSRVGMSGRFVDVYFRPHGTSAWTLLTRIGAMANGGWARGVRPTVDTDYQAYFWGSGTHLGVTSGQVTVRVAPRVRLSAHRVAGARHDSVALSASVTPVHRGLRVSLQRLVDGRWRTTTAARLSSDGHVSFSARPRTHGTARYRLRVPADAHHVATTSAVVRVSVR